MVPYLQLIFTCHVWLILIIHNLIALVRNVVQITFQKVLTLLKERSHCRTRFTIYLSSHYKDDTLLHVKYSSFYIDCLVYGTIGHQTHMIQTPYLFIKTKTVLARYKLLLFRPYILKKVDFDILTHIRGCLVWLQRIGTRVQ